MSDRHRYNPVRLRAADQEWLEEQAAKTGRTLAEVLAEAIAEYRTWRGEEEK